MITFTQYLTESKDGKNLHLEHLEDEIFNGGVSGTRGAINFLQALRDMLAGHAKTKVNVTTKFDGAPAIFAGVNPDNGKFFVGTKGVFAQNAKLNYTPQDIDRNHTSAGLNQKLKIALRYLPELGIDGVLQGDMMFTNADLKKTKIEGETYLTFQPNTIVYAIPYDSDLAKRMMTAKLGVVWHTTYNGDKLSNMRASFGVNITNLRHTKNVWFRDASYVDASGTATFTENETKEVQSILSSAGYLFRTISPRTLGIIATNETFRIYIKTWNNQMIREGQKITNTSNHVAGLMKFVEDKLNKSILEAKKADTKRKRQEEKKQVMTFFKTNRNELAKIYELYNLMIEAKIRIVKKLEMAKDAMGTYMRTEDGYRMTNPEGFVVIDKLNGNAVKVVDRLEFSHNNFNAAKAWDK